MQNFTDKYVTVNGLRLRYIEKGEGPAVLFLHGASLGSSADVFRRNIDDFSAAGFRAISFDQPGFGLSEVPTPQTTQGQIDSVPAFIEAVGLKRVALVAHSRAGVFAMQLGLEKPSLFTHIAILGTNLLLPPATETHDTTKYVAVQARADQQMAEKEPTLADTRKLLEADAFKHQLISDADVELRNSCSTGKAFVAYVERLKEMASVPSPVELWKRVKDLQVPLIMLLGKQDRSQAEARTKVMQQVYPKLAVYLVDDCKHLVPWDAQAEIRQYVIPFLRSPQATAAALTAAEKVA